MQSVLKPVQDPYAVRADRLRNSGGTPRFLVKPVRNAYGIPAELRGFGKVRAERLRNTGGTPRILVKPARTAYGMPTELRADQICRSQKPG